MSTEQDGRTDELQPGQPPIGRGHGPAAEARTIGLAVGALGVVFGDIGTNPLFAMREAFEGHGHQLAVSRPRSWAATS